MKNTNLIYCHQPLSYDIRRKCNNHDGNALYDC